jgi:spoIIIJ-associated protein
MSKFYEFQGKSVDQAIEQASNELRIPAEKIHHEVLSYGSSGIFGLVGVKKAKIKVFVEEGKNKTQRLKPVETNAEGGLSEKQNDSKGFR